MFLWVSFLEKEKHTVGINTHTLHSEGYWIIQNASEGGHIVTGSQSGVNVICTVWLHPSQEKFNTYFCLDES